MSFLQDLGDSLSGKTRSNLTTQTLDIQSQIARDTLAQELAAQQLKYNPALSAERTKQIAYVVIPVGIIIGLIIYFKFIR